MTTNKISIDSANITIDHQDCSDTSWFKGNEIFIESNSNDNNTLTKINFNKLPTIYVFWNSQSSADHFEILYIPETEVLFLGCGTINARISTKEYKLLGMKFITLFWSLERYNNFILELGELECFLYSLDGNKIINTLVDPPYEMEKFDNGIRFKSLVVGTSWLYYDDLL